MDRLVRHIMQSCMASGRRPQKRPKSHETKAGNGLPAHYRAITPAAAMGPAVRANQDWMERNFGKDWHQRQADRERGRGSDEFAMFGCAIVNPATKNGERRAGNLLFTDYRYWWGYPNALSQYSRCRGCRAMVFGLVNRKLHFDQGACGRIVTEAIKTLDDVYCVVCEKRSHEKVWGIPICSQECQNRWMYHDTSTKTTLWDLAIAEARVKLAI